MSSTVRAEGSQRRPVSPAAASSCVVRGAVGPVAASPCGVGGTIRPEQHTLTAGWWGLGGRGAGVTSRSGWDEAGRWVGRPEAGAGRWVRRGVWVGRRGVRVGRRGLDTVAEPPLPAVEGDGEEDQAAEDDLGGRRVDVQDRDDEVQRGDDQGPQAGAEVVAAAAHHGAAHDHRRQAGEQVVVADVGVAAGAEPGQQHSGQAGQHRAGRVHAGPHPPGGDAGQIGRARAGPAR